MHTKQIYYRNVLNKYLTNLMKKMANYKWLNRRRNLNFHKNLK